MAPTRAKAGAAKGSSKRPQKSSKPNASAKTKTSSRPSTAPPASKNKVVKKSSTAHAQKKKKRRFYTEQELDIPKLNTITPAGVRKAKGQKKGKVFVDDQDSMMTILAMVNADKEGQIESKMMRARQMEEIRQARIRETEARAESKKQKLEDAKEELRNKKKDPKIRSSKQTSQPHGTAGSETKKRVSFG